MKQFSFLIHLITLVVAVASIAGIDFPFRKQLLYALVVYVLAVDVLIQIIRRKRGFFRGKNH